MWMTGYERAFLRGEAQANRPIRYDRIDALVTRFS